MLGAALGPPQRGRPSRVRLPRAGRLGSRLPARALCGAEGAGHAVHRSGRGLDRMGASARRVRARPAMDRRQCRTGAAGRRCGHARDRRAGPDAVLRRAPVAQGTGVLCVLPCARARLHRRQALAVGEDRLMGRRRSTPLYAAPFAPRLFWDGRAATLKEQVMGPLHDPREMNHDAAGAVARLDASESYPARFLRAFGAAPGVRLQAPSPCRPCQTRHSMPSSWRPRRLSDRCRPAGARAGRLRRHPAP